MKTSDQKQLVAGLRSGNTLLYPTDTIWGVGCDATQDKAIERVFDLKQRPKNKSLVCLVSDDAMLNRIIPEVPEVAWQLFDESDKPLTLVLPNAQNISSLAMAEDGTVAIRIIRQGPLHQLIYNLRNPLVSTSANISGDNSPILYSDINVKIIEEVDLIADWSEQNMTKSSSSIIKIGVDSSVQIIRP